VFYDPIIESQKTQYAMMSTDTSDTIFRNLKTIVKSHQNFLQTMKTRIDTWNAASLLGDLFFEMVVDISGIYKAFMDNSPKAGDALNN
jgi:hypothetical protein